jgi:hypothetical protein
MLYRCRRQYRLQQAHHQLLQAEFKRKMICEQTQACSGCLAWVIVVQKISKEILFITIQIDKQEV